jgi:hypothetical protein
METERGADLTFAYHGPSMWPTFQEGDVLVAERVDPSQLRRGDCIVFQTAPGAPYTIHRLVRTRPDLRAQGDACPRPDDFPVSPDSVLGRVRALVRLGRVRRVRGGWWGWLSSRWLRYAGRLDPYRNSRGGRLARAFARLCGEVTHRLPLRATTLCLTTPENETTCLMRGRRIIGRWDEQQHRWVFPWPGSLYWWRERRPGPTRNDRPS